MKLTAAQASALGLDPEPEPELMKNDPQYITIAPDTEPLSDLDDLDLYEYPYSPGQPTDQTPASPAAVDRYGHAQIVRATDDEREEWTRAYDTLCATADAINEDLAVARQAWEAAQRLATERRRAAWVAYKPTFGAIRERVEETQSQYTEAWGGNRDGGERPQADAS